MTRTLDWLLDPVPVDVFAEDLWDKQPKLIAHRDPAYFHELFSDADFDRVLEYSQPKPPSLAVVRTGETRPSVEYIQKDGRLDLNQLRYFYSEGYTLIVNGLEKFWPPVAELLQHMMMRLSFRVEANVYLTPRNSQGLRPHYDTHNVIVAQLAGAKTWSLYQEHEHFPRTDSIPPSPIPTEDLGEPRVVEVCAGDVLFVPRGWIHEAKTTDESSLHVTLGVYPPLWHEVMAKSIDALTLRYEALRASLPVGFLHDPDARGRLGAQFAENLAHLADDKAFPEAYAMLQDDFVRLGRSAPDGKMISDLDRVHLIDIETMLVKKDRLVTRVVDLDDAIALQFARSLVTAPPSHRGAVEFVGSHVGPFAVGALPDLGADEQVALAQRLVRDGLLTFATDRTSSS